MKPNIEASRISYRQCDLVQRFRAGKPRAFGREFALSLRVSLKRLNRCFPNSHRLREKTIQKAWYTRSVFLSRGIEISIVLGSHLIPRSLKKTRIEKKRGRLAHCAILSRDLVSVVLAALSFLLRRHSDALSIVGHCTRTSWSMEKSVERRGKTKKKKRSGLLLYA